MDDRPEPGAAMPVAPGIRRILAPNASAMTHWGTNSYVVGEDDVVVIDPGPDDDRHLAALRTAIGDASVAAILITHAHKDHTALAPRLAQEVAAPVIAFGPPEAGRSVIMERLALSGRTGGGEGVDTDFVPDRRMADGETLEIAGHRIEAVHTPGHFPGHLSFSCGEVLFSGDHVMGWSTTLISPPEGDLAAFLASCQKLAARGETQYLPGHGPAVRDPRHLLASLIRHRNDREEQILSALVQGPATPRGLALRIYDGLGPDLLPAAERNVLAHLIDLTERNIVAPDPELAWDATFHRL